MMQSTRTIIETAIRGDSSITPSMKSKMIRYLANPNAEPEMRLFTEKQAAVVLGVSIPTIARMKRDKQLETRTVRGVRRITAESLYRASH